ncbi:hypothetical protein RV03_GL000427 [Enterococcus gallinarum]|nr:hypothetical protein RV03_GL000427 [Enterococcus gallinarum]
MYRENFTKNEKKVNVIFREKNGNILLFFVSRTFDRNSF